MTRIAAVTMVYNEPDYLPLWCTYYGRIFGPESCYIIDHGSDDGSTEGYPGFNIVKIPRSPKDNDKRTRFVSSFCNSMLEWYDRFIYTDVDEILAASDGASLYDRIVRTGEGTFSAYGFNVHHLISEEPDFDARKPVTWQRRWLRFSSSMCKAVLSSQPIDWSPGFHTARSPLNFADLFLFHLRYFDLELGLQRLARTRAMPWAKETAGAHQRVDDDKFKGMMASIARLPKHSGSLDKAMPPLSDYIAQVKASEKDHKVAQYNFDIGISGNELIKIPSSFSGLF